MSFVKRLFGGGSHVEAEPFDDPVLGRVVPAKDGDHWVVEAQSDSGGFRLEIAGNDQPSQAVLERAYEVHRDSARFKAKVAAFLKEQRRVFEDEDPGHGYRDEIAQLQIESVFLTDQGQPGDGMIWFDGPHESSRCWRCDMSKGEPCDLGFDS
ncbi:MAG TPA: hypothetical protein PKA88_34240 [Polyangiaceae bacterium]|nr:hypothetical protein [Polyangiaceae bacterium]